MVKRKKGKKLLSFALGIICALTAGFAIGASKPALAINKESAVKNSFQDSFVTGACTATPFSKTAVLPNGKAYNGYHVTFYDAGSYAEYSKLIDVSASTASDVLFEFLPLMNEGKEFHRYQIFITDSENDNIYLQLSVTDRGDSAEWSGMLAEAKDETATYKPASRFANTGKEPYYSTSDQYAYQLQSSLKNKNNVNPVSIYWDNAGKKIYASPKRNSQVDNLVRDFTLSDSELGIDGYTGTDKFGGFPSGKVKIKVVANNTKVYNANMWFLSAGGEKFARPFGLVESNGNAMAGDEVTLPEITEGWDVKNGVALNVSDLTIETEVKDPSGNAVALSGNRFTVSEEGDYVARFYCEQDSVTYVSEYTLSVGGIKNNDINEAFTASENVTVSPLAKTAVLPSGKAYNGYHVKFDKAHAYVEYKKTVDLSELGAENALLELLPLMDRGKEFHRYVVNITDAENPEIYINLEIMDRSGSQWSSARASAHDETATYQVAGRFNKKYTDSDQYAFHINSSLNNKNQVNPVSIYWDEANKLLRVSPVRTDQDNNIVRDFKLSDGELGIEGYTGTAKFSGFTSGKVKIKIVADNVKESANMYFLSAGGEKFARISGVTPESRGVVGKEYILPAPDNVYNVKKGEAASVSDLTYSVSIKNENGEAVVVTDNKFTPETAGKYQLVYDSKLEGSACISKATLDVVSESDAPEIIINAPEFDKIYYGEQNLTIGASASCGIYYDNNSAPALAVYVSLNDGEYALTSTETAVKFGYGAYKIKYVATDYVGREAQTIKEFEVKRNWIRFSDGVSELENYDEGDEITVSESDIKFWDAELTGEPAEKNVVIEISDDNGANFGAYAPDYSFESGEYVVRYTLTYKIVDGGESYVISASRIIAVRDSVPPTFGDGEKIENVYEDWRVTDDDIGYYVTITGKEVKFSGFTATDKKKNETIDLTGDIKVKFKKGDDALSESDYDKENGFKFVAEENVIYYLSFVVSDGTNQVGKNYVIESKSVWLKAEFKESAYTAELGEEFALANKLNVHSIDGTPIKDYTVKWYYGASGGETELGGALVPKEKGEYSVKAVITSGEQSATATAKITVSDTKKPIITVSEGALKATLGEYFDIPKASVTDNSGESIKAKIFVTAPEGEKKEVFDDKFLAEVEGDYVITYEATDSSGNKAEKPITITSAKKVVKNGCNGGCNKGMNAQSGGFIGLGLLFAAVFYAIKRKI